VNYPQSCYCVPFCMPSSVSDENMPNEKIRMNHVVWQNLHLRLGDIVSVHAFPEIKYGKRFHVFLFDDSMQGPQGTFLRCT